MKTSSKDNEDFAKLRKGNSITTPNPAEAKDSLASDKLQFSQFISPQICSGNIYLCDGPSEGIPVYSFCIDKHAVGAVSAGSDSLLHWNSVGVDLSPMTWSEPVNKSIESSSMPPKLVSGSFHDITYSSTRIPWSFKDSESRESTVRSLYIRGRFQDVSISGTLKGSSSVTGDDALRADSNELTSFARASTVPDVGWKPRGVLVAHLQEHRTAVNDLAISNDHTFFVSASDDSTAKIWDTRKLEKDISFRSRLTYHLDGSRSLCAIMLRTAQVVVGACNGTLHSFSVDCISSALGCVVEKYSGISDIKKKEVREGAILSLLNCSSSYSSTSQTVLYSTPRFGIHLWDMRSNSATWNFKAVSEEGYIRYPVMGQCGNWFVSGSSRGMLTAWDLRFLLPVILENIPQFVLLRGCVCLSHVPTLSLP